MRCCFRPKNKEPKERDNSSPERAGGEAEAASGSSLTTRSLSQVRRDPVNQDIVIFTYEEMMRVTENFSQAKVIGKGGFGKVYRALIDEDVRPGYESTEVAIKVLDRDTGQGDAEWLAEVNVLGQLRHPNIVRLLGYCCEGVHRLLVYEFVENGSFEKQLFKKLVSVPWHKRLKIVMDAARGLAFLHGLQVPIIYRDFKAANILIDKECNAKLSDFGLARPGPVGDETHVTSRILGTFGYAAPEYIMTGRLTTKCDVYGYGAVLLEILLGKEAVDDKRPGNLNNFITTCYSMLPDFKKFKKVLDPMVKEQSTERATRIVANLAYECLSRNPDERPTMRQVIRILTPLVTTDTIREEPGEPSSGAGGASGAGGSGAGGIIINEGGRQNQQEREQKRRHGKGPI